MKLFFKKNLTTCARSDCVMPDVSELFGGDIEKFLIFVCNLYFGNDAVKPIITLLLYKYIEK